MYNVTISNMFEGLTAELLNRSIFTGLSLKIVKNSFICNYSAILIKEIDRIIVIGNGIKVSFTNQYKYHIKDVIAVVQVKKKLFGATIDGAYQGFR